MQPSADARAWRSPLERGCNRRALWVPEWRGVRDRGCAPQGAGQLAIDPGHALWPLWASGAVCGRGPWPSAEASTGRGACDSAPCACDCAVGCLHSLTSWASRRRTSGCSSTSTTPVTTPHTCRLAPSSSPRGGGPPCSPNFSLGMKGEEKLVHRLARSRGLISLVGEWRAVLEQELACCEMGVVGLCSPLSWGLCPGARLLTSRHGPSVVSGCVPRQEGLTIKMWRNRAGVLVVRDMSAPGCPQGAPFLPSLCPLLSSAACSVPQLPDKVCARCWYLPVAERPAFP